MSIGLRLPLSINGLCGSYRQGITDDLSGLINTGLGVFCQFVNTCRVKESKRLLTNPACARLSMEGNGYEAVKN